jgi:hypothetical protein
MRRIACLFILVFAVALVPAMADTGFNFTYQDANYSLQGILTATPDGGGVFTVTGVTGTVS